MFYMTLFHFLILKFSLENFLLCALKYLFMVSLVCIISDRSLLKQVLLSNFQSFLYFASSFRSLRGRLDVRLQLLIVSFPISVSLFLIVCLSFMITNQDPVSSGSILIFFCFGSSFLLCDILIILCFLLMTFDIIVFCSYFDIGILLC